MNAPASSSRPEVLRRLYELMQRVNSVTDLSTVLDEVASGVVEVLGFGVAAISRLEGDTLVMSNVAAPDGARQQILGLRTPVESVVNEFNLADEWGVLRFLPHDRVPFTLEEGIWIPDIEPSDLPGAWHPLDTLYAPLWSATGRLLGNMSVDLPPDGMVPSQEVRELLEMFVVQAGLAIDNAQQRERLGAQVRVGQMLREVSSAGRLADLTSSLRDAGRATAAGFATDRVWIRCFTSGDLDRVEQSYAFPAGLPADAALVAVAVGLARDAARAGAPVVLGPAQQRELPAVVTSPDASRSDLGDGDRSAGLLLLAPVGSEREVLGYLIIAREPDQVWSEEERQAAMEVGKALGRVVLDARLFDRERHLVSELQELDRYKRELIATISHELKTPLSSIIGHTELLADLETGIGSVDAIGRNARRLEGLVRNLLDYSALEESRTHVRDRVDLRALGAASIELVALQAQRHDLTLSMSAPPEPVWVDADGDELGTAVDNLVGNAVKYTPHGGVVTLEVGREGSSAYLSCTDTGLGISPADQAHLFSAFHRSSNPEALSLPGSGLGLAIARRIVGLHSGQITVRSELGRGSTFRVDLPLGSSEADEPD